jgi:hypothetical protein
MEDAISEHSTNVWWVCLLERYLPTKYCATCYGFKRMKEEQGLLIHRKKIMDAAGLEPVTAR